MRDPTESRSQPLPERLFRYILDLEIEKANRLYYPVSLVCLTPDVEASSVDPRLARCVARIALRQLRRTDVIAMLPEAAVGLLFVDTEPGALAGILDRAANALLPEGRRFVRGRQIISVSGGASCYPMTAHDGETLLHEARHLMHRARREGGDRLILPALPLPSTD